MGESYKPPASAVKAAKKGLAQRKEWGRGGLSPSEAKAQGIDSGVTRARKIASGSVSRHDVRRMSAFNRHRKNNRPDKKMPDGGPTAGTIAWNLWGGTSGVNWAKKKSAAMNAETFNAESDAETLDYNSFTNDMEALLAKYSQLLLTYETEYQSKERGGDGIMEVFMRFKPYNAYFDDVDFDAESFGPVDEEGQLAKALAAVREKSKRYAPTPLRLTKLPHPDQKTLKDFEAENTDKIKSVISDIRNYPQLDSFTDEQLLLMGLDCLALRSANKETAFEADEWKLLPRDAKGRWQKPVRSESINELRDSLQTSVPAISELLEMYGGDTPNNRYKLYNDLQSLKIDAMDSALPDDSTASLDMDDMSWMTPSEYYQYVLEEPLDISDDIEDDTQTIEFQDRLVRYTAMTMSPQVIDALIEENELEIVSDLFADPAEAEGEIAFLKAVKRYQRFSEEYSAE